MNVKELAEKFGLEVAAGQKGLEREIRGGFCGDLLSDVMGKAPEACIWLTVQGHQNIVAVAVLRDMAGVIICGYCPDLETKQKADQEGMPVLTWSGSVFDLAGRIYAEIN